ncbi:MAG: HAMP domain-containing histidine kinase [Clostridia bacterium]|nr:HAMP domain-containing histidine kinase [Clostridia bacterium]
MKFWQKTFLLTLLLFLVFLNGGIFSLAVYTHGRNLDSERANCRAEVYYIARAFECDYGDLMSAGRGASPELLMDSYCSFYKNRGVLLEFLNGGETLAGSFANGRREIGADTEGFDRIGGERYFVVSTTVCEGGFTLVYGRSFAVTDKEFESLMITFVVISLAASSLLALALFFVLRRVSAPLEDLRTATEKFAAGDAEARADEKAPGEFGQLGKSFNEMVDKINGQIAELKQNALQKQRLIDDLAHEIRTPLTVIYGYAEYLRRADANEDEKIQCAISVMNEARRLQNVSEKLLDNAVIRENKLNSEPTDLKPLLEETAAAISPLALEKGVRITTECESAVTDGDKTLLGMLFYNLAENALKAVSPGGKVILRCKTGNNGVIACVEDDGKGMTEEQLKHITEPFYRTDAARSRADGGAGLGLTLCSEIAAKHGAKLVFDSAIGKGTRVFCDFRKDLTNDDNAITI